MNLKHALAGALALVCISNPAPAQSALEWAVAQGNGAIIQPLRPAARERTRAPRTAVQTMIADHVSARIGAQWVGTAMRIAHIESRFRCDARNGRAVGIFQNTNPQMFGVSRAAALTCAGGVRAGVAHMAMCIGKGARTPAQMMRCHNSGSPWGRVERAYRVALVGG